jgi:TATA-box binding protein (TBP) (component of TFIID and TFIIIB)
VEKFPQTEYNPSVFPGLVLPFKKTQNCTLILEQAKWSALAPNPKRIAQRS